MQMYKINPKERAITAITYDGTYEGMRPHLTYDFLDYTRITKSDHLFVNDTGLIDGTKYREGAFWWRYVDGSCRKFVGCALLWGTNGYDNTEPSMTLEEASNRISFVQPVGAEEPSEDLLMTEFDTVEDLIKYLTELEGDES